MLWDVYMSAIPKACRLQYRVSFGVGIGIIPRALMWPTGYVQTIP